MPSDLQERILSIKELLKVPSSEVGLPVEEEEKRTETKRRLGGFLTPQPLPPTSIAQQLQEQFNLPPGPDIFKRIGNLPDPQRENDINVILAPEAAKLGISVEAYKTTPPGAAFRVLAEGGSRLRAVATFFVFGALPGIAGKLPGLVRGVRTGVKIRKTPFGAIETAPGRVPKIGELGEVVSRANVAQTAQLEKAIVETEKHLKELQKVPQQAVSLQYLARHQKQKR